jgi:hypothetical protein
MILDDQWTAKTVIYPLLCSSFSQCVAVTQIIDFNVLDVVTVLLVHVPVDGRGGVGSRRLGDWSLHLEVSVSRTYRLSGVDLQRE